MYSSSNICLDGCTTEHLPSFQPDPMLSNSDVSGASALLHKDSEKKLPPESDYYSSSDVVSSLMCSSQLELNPSGDSTRRHPSPASTSCGHFEWNLNSGHQAKRARVENIIKGMTSSPGAHCTDVMMNQHEETDSMQGNEKMQELLLHQDHMQRNEARETRKQPQSQNQQLRQLRTRFTHGDGVSDTMDISKERLAEEKYPTWNNSPDRTPMDTCTDSYGEFESDSSRKYQGWKKVKLMNYFQSKPEKIKLMADVLKYELSRAVSRSVDSIFKTMPLLQASQTNEGSVETDWSFRNVHKQPSVCKDHKLGLLCCGSAGVQVPEVQTEALSLVVQKPQLERPDTFILQSRSRAHHRPKLPVSFSHDSTLHEDQTPEQIHNVAHQNTLRSLQGGCSETKFETFDASWNSVKIRSKVNSRSVRSPQTRTVTVDPMLLESLCLPHVKIESDNLLKNNLYMVNVSFTSF